MSVPLKWEHEEIDEFCREAERSFLPWEHRQDADLLCPECSSIDFVAAFNVEVRLETPKDRVYGRFITQLETYLGSSCRLCRFFGRFDGSIRGPFGLYALSRGLMDRRFGRYIPNPGLHDTVLLAVIKRENRSNTIHFPTFEHLRETGYICSLSATN